MRSPLAPEHFPDLPPIDGVRFATVAAGVRYKDRHDVMLAEIAPGATVAGVFTQSTTRSDAVRDCQAKLKAGLAPGGAAILVNSGNANAFTGHAGQLSVQAITKEVAQTFSVAPPNVLTASTGVIGEPLDHDKILQKLFDLKAGLSSQGLQAAARAIMTTDTFPKGAVAKIKVSGRPVKIVGIAKGSGMIAPDMATMLAFVFTDAAVSADLLQKLVVQCTQETFNAITVDSDTSTSDTVITVATGKAGHPVLETARAARAFKAGLHKVFQDLALQIVSDGEGATKRVKVQVTGAKSRRDARKVAGAIANSPLVKTAIAGEDPNWGRVVMAVGKSGALAERDHLSIWFGDVLVAERGWRAPDYREEDAAAYMKNQEITLRVDLGLGTAKARMWTCDLTDRYIQINADYRS